MGLTSKFKGEKREGETEKKGVEGVGGVHKSF